MSTGFDTLKKRLDYYGGGAEQRINNDKLRSLKSALKNAAYQSETAILEDGREFKCLINPDKETEDYDNKIISIPYRDVCLNKPRKGKTSDGQEDIGLKCGDTFEWKETQTHWIVYLQYLEESAYFRADIRKCDQETEINGKKYWTWIRGPVETSVTWNQKGGVEWNDLNYSLVMYVKRDENTLANLKRFTKLKVKEPTSEILKTWQVVAVNPYHGDGIIEVCLDEYFENSIQDAVNEENEKKESANEQESPCIEGPNRVAAYDRTAYKVLGITGGEWFITYKGKKESLGATDNVTIEVNTNKGTILLEYITQENTLSKNIEVIPF